MFLKKKMCFISKVIFKAPESLVRRDTKKLLKILIFEGLFRGLEFNQNISHDRSPFKKGVV